jgi:hypothetical protein
MKAADAGLSKNHLGGGYLGYVGRGQPRAVESFGCRGVYSVKRITNEIYEAPSE